jgi:hypothetical protein
MLAGANSSECPGFIKPQLVTSREEVPTGVLDGEVIAPDGTSTHW